MCVADACHQSTCVNGCLQLELNYERITASLRSDTVYSDLLQEALKAKQQERKDRMRKMLEDKKRKAQQELLLKGEASSLEAQKEVSRQI